VNPVGSPPPPPKAETWYWDWKEQAERPFSAVEYTWDRFQADIKKRFTDVREDVRAWRELRKMTYSDEIHSFLTIRMPITVFEDLCTWLRKNTEVDGTKGLDIEESVAIFLYIVGRNASNRDAQERFQHSGETISR
jgi:hypothetical protein